MKCYNALLTCTTTQPEPPSPSSLKHLCAPLRFLCSRVSLCCAGAPRESSVNDGHLLRGNPYLFSVKGWIGHKSEPTLLEGLKVGPCGCRAQSSCRRFSEAKEPSRIE